MAWPAFLRSFARVAAGAAVFVYATILVVDPYDTLWFSPPLERAPVATNQRFSFPALARKPHFDSAVIGTSTTRLLRPADLDVALDGRFVNLSMNSGTAWEQARILEVFARAHPDARNVIFGLDATWCATGDGYEKLTPRPFPPWMYDEDRWNDLIYLFNIPTLTQVGRQLGHLTGLRPSEYGRDGYTNFLPDAASYDLAKARMMIYGSASPPPLPRIDPAAVEEAVARFRERFPTHELFAEMLGRLAPATRKIVLFVPYHVFLQRQGGVAGLARTVACKRDLIRLAGAHENVHIFDFMIESEITATDANYWDPLHFSTEVAARLSRLIGEGVKNPRQGQGYVYAGDGR